MCVCVSLAHIRIYAYTHTPLCISAVAVIIRYIISFRGTIVHYTKQNILFTSMQNEEKLRITKVNETRYVRVCLRVCAGLLLLPAAVDIVRINS